MGDKADSDWVLGSGSGGSIKPNPKDNTKKTAVFQLRVKQVKALIVEISAVLLLSVLCLTPLAGALELNPFGLLALLTLIALLWFGTMWILGIVISIWRSGRFIRKKISEWWDSATPPHEFSIDSLSFHSLTKARNHLTKPTLLSDEYPARPLQTKKDLLAAIFYLVVGFFIQVACLFLVILNANQLDTLGSMSMSLNPAVSTFAAFLSVLLGPLTGALTLGTFAFFDSPGAPFLLFISMVIPSIWLAPGVRNLLESIVGFFHIISNKSAYGLATTVFLFLMLVIGNTALILHFWMTWPI